MAATNPPPEGDPTPPKEAAKPGARRRGRKSEPPLILNRASAAVLNQLRLQTEFRVAETEEDARLRRRKDLLGFLVKDLAVYALGLIVIGGTASFCLSVLLNPKSSPESQQRAWTAITAILTGIVGFVFGKAAAK